MAASRYRYAINGGPWVEMDTVPGVIPSLASDSVLVQTLGPVAVDDGVSTSKYLTLTYDAAKPNQEIEAKTNVAGTFYWMVSTATTIPSAADIVAGTGAWNNTKGSVATVAGVLGLDLGDFSGTANLFMYAVIKGANGAADSSTAGVRVFIGAAKEYATISSASVSRTDYTDTSGTAWIAYVFAADGSITIPAGGTGKVEYEIIAGGGGGGGGNGYTSSGGGGAGGVVRDIITLEPGTYNITVGAKGVGATAPNGGTNGGDSSAFGITAIGGGRGQNASGASYAGGSGGGYGSGPNPNGPGAGTPGQGYNGGSAATNTGSGGGGAGGVGGTPAGNGQAGGNGGLGIETRITGVTERLAGGGGGSGTPQGTTGTDGGGNGGVFGPGDTYTAGTNATTPGSGGGGSSHSFKGGDGFRGRVVVRVKA